MAPLSDMDGLLPALRDAFGTTAQFLVSGMVVSFEGRFRIDPWDVDVGNPEALGATQTWFYVDTRDIPWQCKPGLGDYLLIRCEWWEIVQIDADDLGELGYRLVKGGTRAPAIANAGAD